MNRVYEAIFQDTFNIIPDFAEEHWDTNETDLKLGWEKKLKNIRFEERLKNSQAADQLIAMWQSFDLIKYQLGLEVTLPRERLLDYVEDCVDTMMRAWGVPRPC